MAHPGNSLFRRIRNVKSSLDNAEQSFLDNKDIRGELDLMLAEAELKNLRKKKDVPWSWNRQLLAGCIAVLLVLAGVGGWYFARDHYKQRSSTTIVPAAASAAAVDEAPPQPVTKPQKARSVVTTEQAKDSVTEAAPKQNQSQVSISKSDLRKLVQSARVELSNSK